jgi:hypothetical protein
MCDTLEPNTVAALLTSAASCPSICCEHAIRVFPQQIFWLLVWRWLLSWLLQLGFNCLESTARTGFPYFWALWSPHELFKIVNIITSLITSLLVPPS